MIYVLPELESLGILNLQTSRPTLFVLRGWVQKSVPLAILMSLEFRSPLVVNKVIKFLILMH